MPSDLQDVGLDWLLGLRQETPTTHGAGCLTTDMGRFIPDQSATYFFRGIAASPVMMKRAMLPFCVNMAAELFNANLWCFPSLVSMGTGLVPARDFEKTYGHIKEQSEWHVQRRPASLEAA